MPNSPIIYQLTKRQKKLISFLFFLVKYHEISTKKKNATTSLEPGK